MPELETQAFRPHPTQWGDANVFLKACARCGGDVYTDANRETICLTCGDVSYPDDTRAIDLLIAQAKQGREGHRQKSKDGRNARRKGTYEE